jgi:outer membrane receptor protein involved in Fe transport
MQLDRLLAFIFDLLIVGALPIGGENTAVISGQVLDLGTARPVAGATIAVAGTDRGTVSESRGRFCISELEPGNYFLRVSCVGYTDEEVSAGSDDEENKELVIYLRPTAVPVGRITVTGGRVAARIFESSRAVSAISGEEFSERSSATTAELLREEPGLLVQKTTYGHGAPIVRGLIGRHVLLLYDGIRLNRSTFRSGGNQYLNTVNHQFLDRIEVVRGPASVLYGSDALGGAINLIPFELPRPGDNLRLQPRFSTRYATADNSYRLTAGADGDIRLLTFSSGLSLKGTGNLRAGGNVGRQDPTGWDETAAVLQLLRPLGRRWSLRLNYLAVRQDRVPRYDKYAGGQFREYRYDPQDRDLAAVTFSVRPSDGFLQAARGSLAWQREVEGRIEQKIDADYQYRSHDRLTTWGGYGQAVLVPHPAHQLLVGGEYYREKIAGGRVRIDGETIETVRPTYPDGSVYRSAGLFLQDEWELVDRLKLTAGLRYSRFAVETLLEAPFGEFREDYEDLTGSVGISYRPWRGINLVGNWSRGYRAPSLNDMAVLKVSSSGVDAPSPGLKPESIISTEMGIKLDLGPVSGGLIAFNSRLDDMIDRTRGLYNGLPFFDENNNGLQDSSEFDIYQRRNVGRARLYGFELEGSYRSGSGWEGRLNCFWIRGENRSLGEPLSRIPPLMDMVAFRMYPTESVWIETFLRTAAAQRRLSSRDEADNRIDPGGTDGWVTLNFRTRFNRGRLSLAVSVENITDAAYKEHGSGIYSAGRNLILNLNLSR